MKQAIFYVCFLVPFLWGCVEEIELDSVPVNKALVVNSFITPDSVFSCYVSRVRALNDTLPRIIDHATVMIYNTETNEEVAQLHHISNGYYEATLIKPVSLKTYRLLVKADGYPQVTATTSIPEKQLAENISLEYTAGYDFNNSLDYDELRFSVTDKEEDDSYFGFQLVSVNLIKKLVYYDWDAHSFVTIPMDTTYINEDASGYAYNTIVDAVIQNEGITKYNPSFLIFSDELFNMKKHDFTIRCNHLMRKYSLFSFFTLSPEMYKHQLSLIQHSYENGQKGISHFDELAGLDFSNHSIPVYSNTTGGYGIFAGYNTQLKFAPNIKLIKIVYDEYHQEIRREYDRLIHFDYDDPSTFKIQLQ